MSTQEKIKKTVVIALGFALATYLIMSGTAILNQDNQDTNATQKIEKND
ncbi:hypothetical protein JHD47_02100 [Sulfurimonas sp. SAG-AH-194-L11]|nr:hypothetical protein [Sulfurimonas sp. SAG-AH-194-L11]MDF1876604.1 hypothetical protein [Sulfurimonas sp. SAG-AH-194-L11]